jgi:hypothetical protein
MLKTYEALLDRFDELHRAIREALDGMPREALDWIPGPEMNSMSVLIMHLTGAERYWVGDVVRGEPSFRDREAEFRAKDLGHDPLRQRLTDLQSYEKGVFESMGLAQLEEERVSPRDGRKYTVAWALSHALEHTAMHVGHIQILSQLWKQKK